MGNLFGPCGHPEGPRTEKTTHCKVSVRRLDFLSDFLHFSDALDFQKQGFRVGGVHKTTFSTETEKNTILYRFCHRFTDHLDHVGDLWLTLGARGTPFFLFLRLDFSIRFLMDFRPRRVPQKGTRRQGGVCSGAMVKRHILRKAWLISR